MIDTFQDNPFIEAGDDDRTVVFSAKAGRPAIAEDATQAAAPSPRRVARVRPAEVEVADLPVGFGAPLLAAAAPLLQLLGRLRNTLTPPDAGDLRDRAAQAMRAFEQCARAEGVPESQLRPAHYALCASLDDVVLNTPWGSAGAWASQSLVSGFHNEVEGGERFFTLLTRLQQNPGKFRPVLELMYLCLSLGFVGKYRLSPRGPAELDRVREDVYAAIATVRPTAEAELSPMWQGVAVPYRPVRLRAPLWVLALAGLAAVSGAFLWFSVALNVASDAVDDRIAQLAPAQMPAITRTAPPQPVRTVVAEPGPLERLRTFLKPEIDANLVSVLGTEEAPLIRVQQAGIFASGSATVAERSVPLLLRIGAALKTEPGAVQVIGHTDDQPIHTVRFPSNFQLSVARAASAGDLVVGALGDAARVQTEGRGSTEPIAPNDTADGRQANRRIDIVLHRAN
jgi:type VI secretion system protein ImpK